jgi:FAD/FMN-containing dehydrogenase
MGRILPSSYATIAYRSRVELGGRRTAGSFEGVVIDLSRRFDMVKVDADREVVYMGPGRPSHLGDC